MLVKYQGIIYLEYFFVYCIGDGKLFVSDVWECVWMIMDFIDCQVKCVKFYYKGCWLRDVDVFVREYGVKNNSEVFMVLDDLGQVSSEDSNEELVVVGCNKYEGQVIRNGCEKSY